MWTKSGDPACLAPYRWKNRILLIFAPSAEHSDYAKQVQALEGEFAGVVERDLLVAELLEDGDCRVGDCCIDPVSRALLRGNFGVEPGDFVVILIGKDGTEKLWSELPVPADELFSLIDSMPIRRREMEEGHVAAG